jgi:transcriptional regulator with PAS, ATPase and Fis domain
MVGQGRFREDLYYRINLIDLRIPPVRERREDVLWLACGYLAERAEEQDGPSHRSGRQD